MQIAHLPRSPLYVRTILFVTLVCAIMLGLDVRQVWLARSVRLQQAQTETANLARSLAQHAQDVFESTDATLKGLRATFAEDGGDPGAMARLGRRMRTRVMNQDIIQRLFLYDANGNWLDGSLDAATFAKVRDLNYVDRDYFRYHRDHTEDVAFLGPPIQTKFDGAWVVTVTRRLTHSDGSFAGVVGASISLKLFQRFFETFDTGGHGAITLTSGQGMLIVRRPFDTANIGRSVAQSEFFRAIQDNADTGSFDFISSLDGRPRLGSFHRVSGFDLIMIVALDKNEVLTSWWHGTQVQLIGVILIVAIVALAGYQITLQIHYRAIVEVQLAEGRKTLEQRVIDRTADLQRMVTQRDLLLREVYHRVNNNMQVVDGLLALEAMHLTDAWAQQALRDMRTRVHVLGRAHEQLMVSADLKTFDFAPFLRELAASVLTNRGDDGISLIVEAIPLMVTLDFAIPMGLVVSELMTICSKQAFLLGNGCVTLNLRNNIDNFALAVSDNRLGSTNPADADGGETARRMRLLTSLVRQIDGTLKMHDEGTCVEILFAKPILAA